MVENDVSLFALCLKLHKYELTIHCVTTIGISDCSIRVAHNNLTALIEKLTVWSSGLSGCCSQCFGHHVSLRD